MADDLDKAIKSIAQMFGMTKDSPTEAPQGGSDAASPEPGTPAPSFNAQSIKDNLGLLSKARDMMDTFNNVSDSRINLLASIQPFLGPQRQLRCNSCIQILKVLAVINSITPNKTNLR